MASIEGKLTERGNGFPRVGQYVCDDCDLYLVVRVGGTIHTDDYGVAYVYAALELADWNECAEVDVHPAGFQAEGES